MALLAAETRLTTAQITEIVRGSEETMVLLRRRKRRREITELLEALLEKHPTGRVYVAWDNSNTHEDNEVEAVSCAERQIGCGAALHAHLQSLAESQRDALAALQARRDSVRAVSEREGPIAAAMTSSNVATNVRGGFSRSSTQTSQKLRECT